MELEYEHDDYDDDSSDLNCSSLDVDQMLDYWLSRKDIDRPENTASASKQATLPQTSR